MKFNMMEKMGFNKGKKNVSVEQPANNFEKYDYNEAIRMETAELQANIDDLQADIASYGGPEEFKKYWEDPARQEKFDQEKGLAEEKYRKVKKIINLFALAAPATATVELLSAFDNGVSVPKLMVYIATILVPAVVLLVESNKRMKEAVKINQKRKEQDLERRMIQSREEEEERVKEEKNDEKALEEMEEWNQSH